jgi:hypothetical protein
MQLGCDKMSEIWYFKCLKCDEKNEDGLNHGDKILLNVLRHVDTIKSLLDSDEFGYLQISMMGIGTEPIDFLMEHYGGGHDVVVCSEYGKIKRS